MTVALVVHCQLVHDAIQDPADVLRSCELWRIPGAILQTVGEKDPSRLELTKTSWLKAEL